MTFDQQLLAKIEDTLAELLKFPLMEALIGRQFRRFCMGSEIPDGVFAFKSKYKPLPLSEIEQRDFTDELKIVALNAMDKLSRGSSRYTVTSTCPEEPHRLMEDVLYSAVVRSH